MNNIDHNLIESSDEPETGRITMIEAISYTAVIVLIGATASGWFDVMAPWR